MKKIMFVGTASSVGKSLISAGVGRILMQDGYRCAPFKAQNMSRNATVLKDGSEIASAQRLQADACGVEADVRMGPIVLKPTSDNGSELILHGKPQGHYKAREYYARKEELLSQALKAYHSLEEEFDVCVIEGAGGVAEINLRDKDLVNLGFATPLSAPVVLIGDIDRGGVFASLYGSVALLSKEDQKLIKAFIINKFRGDVTLLDSGIRQLEELLGIPCMGVIPYRDFGLEEEDSLGLRDHDKSASIHCGIIHLPTITNFNDFHSLERDPRLSLHYLKNVDELSKMDLILLPGSSDLEKDYAFLEEKGFFQVLKQLRDDQLLLAIGQGISFLTQEIDQKRALAFLPMTTKSKGTHQKRRIHGSRTVDLFGQSTKLLLRGYESLECEFSEKDICYQAAASNVLGITLHGVFFEDSFKQEILSALYRIKGLDLPEYVAPSKEESLNQLADHLRKNLDMDLLYRILE